MYIYYFSFVFFHQGSPSHPFHVYITLMLFCGTNDEQSLGKMFPLLRANVALSLPTCICHRLSTLSVSCQQSQHLFWKTVRFSHLASSRTEVSRLHLLLHIENLHNFVLCLPIISVKDACYKQQKCWCSAICLHFQIYVPFPQNMQRVHSDNTFQSVSHNFKC